MSGTSPAAASASVYASLTRTRDTVADDFRGCRDDDERCERHGRALGCVAADTICIVHPTLPQANLPMVFDGFRRSFEELLNRATRPEERRVVASRMKETLVQARMGLDDLRDGPREGAAASGRRGARAGDRSPPQAARRGDQRSRDGRHRGEVRGDAQPAGRGRARRRSPRRKPSWRSPSATSATMSARAQGGVGGSGSAWRGWLQSTRSWTPESPLIRRRSTTRSTPSAARAPRPTARPTRRDGSTSSSAGWGREVIIQHWSGVVTATLLVRGRRLRVRAGNSARAVRRPADRRDRRAVVRADGGGVSARAVARQGRRRDPPNDERAT